MIYFTSDFHLSHDAIREYSNRPFDNIEDMNETIIQNFFDTVRGGDVVYFLGDLSWDTEVAKDFLFSIPKNISFHFIVGNHDKNPIIKVAKGFCDSVSWMRDIKIKEQKITLCHYPMISWNCSHWGAFMLHGHHHSNIIEEKFPDGKIMNVGVDENDFYPVSFTQVQVYMEHRKDNWDLIKK